MSLSGISIKLKCEKKRECNGHGANSKRIYSVMNKETANREPVPCKFSGHIFSVALRGGVIVQSDAEYFLEQLIVG